MSRLSYAEASQRAMAAAQLAEQGSTQLAQIRAECDAPYGQRQTDTIGATVGVTCFGSSPLTRQRAHAYCTVTRDELDDTAALAERIHTALVAAHQRLPGQRGS